MTEQEFVQKVAEIIDRCNIDRLWLQALEDAERTNECPSDNVMDWLSEQNDPELDAAYTELEEMACNYNEEHGDYTADEILRNCIDCYYADSYPDYLVDNAFPCYVADDTGAIFHEGTYDECYAWMQDPIHKEIMKSGALNPVIMSIAAWQRFFIESELED